MNPSNRIDSSARLLVIEIGVASAVMAAAALWPIEKPAVKCNIITNDRSKRLPELNS
jgi:hypothetical protein